MKRMIVIGVAVLSLGAMAPQGAQAAEGGCLKYGLGGAIAGHFAGGHRLKGAAAGCALGIYQRRRAERRMMREREERGGYVQDRRRVDPDETGALRRRAPREYSY